MVSYGSKEAKELLAGIKLATTGDKSTSYAKFRMSQEEYAKIYPLIGKIIIYIRKSEHITSGFHWTVSREFVGETNISDIVAVASGDDDGAGWDYWYTVNFKDGTSYTSPHQGRWYWLSDNWF